MLRVKSLTHRYANFVCVCVVRVKHKSIVLTSVTLHVSSTIPVPKRQSLIPFTDPYTLYTFCWFIMFL